MRTLWNRLRAAFHSRKSDRRLAEEVATHLEMRAAELCAQGVDPASARQAARREFGGIDQMTEVYRAHRGIFWIENLVKDAGYAMRGLRHNPGFAAAAVLSLALGIGANTAIFSFINALMLHLLPVQKPEQLVNLYRTGGWGKGYASYPLYLEFRKREDLFLGVFARSGAEKVRFDQGHGAGAEYAAREFVSGNYFNVLGVKPAMGRLFADSDNRTPHAHSVAVLSYDFWRTRLGMDPAILGRVIRAGEQPLTIIGVAAPGFRGVELESRTDIWVPAMMREGDVLQPGLHWIWIMARCRPEIPRARIQAAANTVMAQYLAAVYGRQRETAFGKFALAQKIEVRDAGVGISMLRDTFGKPLMILMAAVALVLLIACANVANLQIARGAARRREIALRFSLGASRGRVVRQWLMESLILSLLGCLLALALAAAGTRYMLLFLPPGTGDSFRVAPDSAVLAFAIAISLVSALLSGLAPAWRATSLDPLPALKDGAPQHTGSGRAGFRQVLIVLQVALSVVLVAAAATFAHSLAALRSIHPGFVAQNVATFALDYPQSWNSANKQNHRAMLLSRIAALPGVQSASYGVPGPYLGGSWTAAIRVPGSPRTAREGVEIQEQAIGPAYFSTLGAHILRGREFDANDLRSARKIAVVNEAFVHEFLAGAPSPLDRVLSFDDSKPEGGEPTYIVGVVGDLREAGIKEPPQSTVYVPFHQDAASFGPMLVVRAAMPAEAMIPLLRRAIESVDPEVAIVEPRTLRQRVDDSIFVERAIATLSGFFGALALLLAAIGIYGLVAYTVARRTSEIGLRIALGAQPSRIVWMVLTDGLLLIALGIAAGLPLALAAGRISASLLFGIPPHDWPMLAVTVGVLLAIGLAAAILPGRRAAGIQPSAALRHD